MLRRFGVILNALLQNQKDCENLTGGNELLNVIASNSYYIHITHEIFMSYVPKCSNFITQ